MPLVVSHFELEDRQELRSWIPPMVMIVSVGIVQFWHLQGKVANCAGQCLPDSSDEGSDHCVFKLHLLSAWCAGSVLTSSEVDV
jgi:hypothetical protein